MPRFVTRGPCVIDTFTWRENGRAKFQMFVELDSYATADRLCLSLSSGAVHFSEVKQIRME